MTEKTIPKPLEAIVKLSYAPLAYIQATGVGLGVALGDYMRNSRLGASFQQYLGEEAGAKKVDFMQSFKEGYHLVLEAHGYKTS